MRAIIWTSAPDPIDGYYVELLGKHNVIEYAVWRATVEQCREWAMKNGATKIEEN
jgi:hypothetical protein